MSLITLLRQTAEHNSNKPAYIAGEKTITYGELWKKASAAAELLKRQGTEPVILLGRKEPSLVIGMIACLLSGRAYVPVDRFLPDARIRKIVEASGASLLLCEEDANHFGIPCCSLGGLAQYSSSEPKKPSGKIAYIIFTSGTTGEPKGVPISTENLLNFTNWLNRLEPLASYKNASVLNQASFSFDLSVADLFYSFTNGHTLTALESADLVEIGAVFRKSRIDVCIATPTFIKFCMTDPDFDAVHYPSLRCIYFCGETLDIKTVAKLWNRFPDLEIINAYGPTEATSAVSAVRIRKDMLDQPLLPAGETENSAAEIEIDNNEIILKGKSVFSGYLNGITGGYFQKNGRNCYRTGDLGYIENGYLYCRGRMDSQIKYKGYRIELSDIEQNIINLNGVEDCVVIAARNPDHTVKYLTAYVTGKHPDNLRERLKSVLPDYMIPKNIRILDRLPMNANGKIDRKALNND